MNILHITNHLNIGGITSYALTLTKGLREKGHNVYIASFGGGFLQKFIDEGIRYIPIPIRTKQDISPKILISMFRLLPQIKKNNIEVIHSHSRTTQILGYLLSNVTNVTYVSTCHGFFKRKFFRKIFPCWGRRVIAISEPVKEHLINDFAVKQEKIRVIHNGIDVNRFRPKALDLKVKIKRDLGLTDGPVVGIVARLSDVKGHIYLIEAMKPVVEQMPQAQLLIVGEGKMKDELVKCAENLGIIKNVFFVPEVEDTSEVLSIMDLFVMPSLKEGLGLALMEAMAFGLAVIGSDVGGIKTLIQDRRNGLLVKSADAKELSLAILKLLQDKDLASSLGRAANIFINQNFSQEKMVLDTERVYLECLKLKN